MLFFKNTGRYFSTLGIFILFLNGCSDTELHPEDVEYRVDENGTELLYQIGKDYPFGYGERSYIVDYFPNKKIKFKIEFFNGKRHGNFTFWQDNGLPVLKGRFEHGKRDGTFEAFGKIGELIYEKNYSNDELNGIFKLYYPASHKEISSFFENYKGGKSSNKGLFKKVTSWFSNDTNLNNMESKNTIRMDANFSDGKPHGRYQIFYHPKGKQLTAFELLKEEGSFKNGKLLENQTSYYPRTYALIVVLPNKKRLDQNYPPNPMGFSHAIDDANKEYLKVPSYRNPDNSPALVYTIDEKGEKIAPIWTAHISEVKLRKSDKTLLDIDFKPNYEDYLKAKSYASENFSYGGDINFSKSNTIPTKSVLEVVGVNKDGGIVDILWSSNELSEAVPLDKRINHKRIKIKRKWSNGIADESIWSLTNGSKIRIKDNSFSNLFAKDKGLN